MLLETALAFPRKQVFVLRFPVGEFDMVVFDPDAAHCEIYEIKHSTKAAPQQYRFLVEDGKCAQTEHRFGPIVAKRVLYRGKSFNEGEVEYVNVEEYLEICLAQAKTECSRHRRLGSVARRPSSVLGRRVAASVISRMKRRWSPASVTERTRASITLRAF